MTKKDLTKGYVKKIAEEFRRSLNYFGVMDEYDIRLGVKRKLEELWEMASYKSEEELQTDDGIVKGCPIMVALGGEDFEDEVRDGKTYIHTLIQSLYLVVNAEDFQYVLSSFDSYHPRGTRSFDDDIYGDYTYKKVRLEEVDKTKMARSLY